MNNKARITKKIKLEGIIEAKTGLHIGGNNVGLAIGGADATVVRNPFTNQPYIPGSSLKGKMRSLVEKLEGKFTKSGITNAGPFVKDPEDPICMVFGFTPEEIGKAIEAKHGKGSYKPEEHDLPVSRLIVRDCPLEKASAKALELLKSTDMPFTEVKTEVVIDRITSAATPRQLERVPAGAIFEMSMILNIHEGDDEAMLLQKIFQSLLLVQDDYIGGKGTRGSGQVGIELKPLKFKEENDYKTGGEWRSYPADGIVPAALLKLD